MPRSRMGVGGVMGALVRGSARHAPWVVVVVLLATVVMAAGIPRLHSHVDPLDALPQDDPNTLLARRVEAEFPSGYTQQVNVAFAVHGPSCHADSARMIPQRLTTKDCGNITDEVYIRALDEASAFFEERSDIFHFFLGPDAIYRLLNWTYAGGEQAPPESFALPGTDPQGSFLYRSHEEVLWNGAPELMDPLVGIDHDLSGLVLVPDPDRPLTHAEVGAEAFRLIDAYVAAVEAGDTRYTVFGPENPPIAYTELATGSAHSLELLEEDARWLLPLAAATILVLLAIAFRSPRAVLLNATTLVVGAVWTLGLMGWLGIAIDPFNVAVPLLVLGLGIDMGLHLTTAYQASDQSGLDAFRSAGRRAGLALSLATATTVVGLLVLAASPTPIIVRLACMAAFAVFVVFLLAVTFLPALIRLTHSGKRVQRAFHPAAWVERCVVQLRRVRWLVLPLVVLAAAAGAWSAQTWEAEPFGDASARFPADDPARSEHERLIQRYYGSEPGEPLFIANALVLTGDMLDPTVHDWIRAIADGMEDQTHVRTDTLLHWPLLVELYDLVKDGYPGAVAVTAQEILLPQVGLERDKPDTREEIEASTESALSSPLSMFAATFVSPGLDMSIMTFSTAVGDLDDVERSWDQVQAAIAAADGMRPPESEVGFMGTTATNHIFVDEQLPFVAWLSIASFAAVAVLVFVVTRDPRLMATVTGIVVASSLIWVGVLQILGIGVSIYLVVPLVLISAVGSDYALHLLLALRLDGHRAYAVAGKAIVFGMLTDAAAFAWLALARDLPTARTMAAAALAVGITFAVTGLVAASVGAVTGRGVLPGFDDGRAVAVEGEGIDT